MGRRAKKCFNCKHPINRHGVVGCLIREKADVYFDKGRTEFCSCDVSIKDFEGYKKTITESVKKKKKKRRGK